MVNLRTRQTGAMAQLSGQEKPAQEPYRISSFQVVFTLDSDLDAAVVHRLAEQAEAMCTISNTLKSQTEMRLTLQ